MIRWYSETISLAREVIRTYIPRARVLNITASRLYNAQEIFGLGENGEAPRKQTSIGCYCTLMVGFELLGTIHPG